MSDANDLTAIDSVAHSGPNTLDPAGETLEVIAGCGCLASVTAMITWSTGETTELAFTGDATHMVADMKPVEHATFGSYHLEIRFDDRSTGRVPAVGESFFSVGSTATPIYIVPAATADNPLSIAAVTHLADVPVTTRGEGEERSSNSVPEISYILSSFPIGPDSVAVTTNAYWILNQGDNDVVRIGKDGSRSVVRFPDDAGLFVARALAVADDEATLFIGFSHDTVAFSVSADTEAVELWRKSTPYLRQGGLDIVDGYLIARMFGPTPTVLSTATGEAAPADAPDLVFGTVDIRDGTAKVSLFAGGNLARQFTLTTDQTFYAGLVKWYDRHSGTVWVQLWGPAIASESGDADAASASLLVGVDDSGGITQRLLVVHVPGDNAEFTVRDGRLYHLDGSLHDRQLAILSTCLTQACT
ncbi:MAG: hypothetical protein Q7V57_16090 [Actinomycetota bacterium]|nr:hypothetical protein [Actinomycetota bacterium]